MEDVLVRKHINRHFAWLAAMLGIVASLTLGITGTFAWIENAGADHADLNSSTVPVGTNGMTTDVDVFQDHRHLNDDPTTFSPTNDGGNVLSYDHAQGGSATNYFFRYLVGGSGSNSRDIPMYTNTNNVQDEACYFKMSLAVNDQLKFFDVSKGNEGWYGWSHRGNSTLFSTNFTVVGGNGEDADNIKCTVAGCYDFFISDKFLIYIEPHSDTVTQNTYGNEQGYYIVGTSTQSVSSLYPIQNDDTKGLPLYVNKHSSATDYGFYAGLRVCVDDTFYVMNGDRTKMTVWSDGSGTAVYSCFTFDCGGLNPTYKFTVVKPGYYCVYLVKENETKKIHIDLWDGYTVNDEGDYVDHSHNYPSGPGQRNLHPSPRRAIGTSTAFQLNISGDNADWTGDPANYAAYFWNHYDEGANYIYLKAGIWDADGARFAVYTGSDWYNMSNVSGDLYRVSRSTVEGEESLLIFCRMNGSNQTNDWSNRWNQTGNLTLATNSTNNLFTISQWNSQTSGWGKQTNYIDNNVRWVRLARYNSTNYYTGITPSVSENKVIFVRLNPNTDNVNNDPSWDNVWNQTEDIDLAASSNANSCFSINGKKTVDDQERYTGAWGPYEVGSIVLKGTQNGADKWTTGIETSDLMSSVVFTQTLYEHDVFKLYSSKNDGWYDGYSSPTATGGAISAGYITVSEGENITVNAEADYTITVTANANTGEITAISIAAANVQKYSVNYYKKVGSTITALTGLNETNVFPGDSHALKTLYTETGYSSDGWYSYNPSTGAIGSTLISGAQNIKGNPSYIVILTEDSYNYYIYGIVNGATNWETSGSNHTGQPSASATYTSGTVMWNNQHFNYNDEWRIYRRDYPGHDLSIWYGSTLSSSPYAYDYESPSDSLHNVKIKFAGTYDVSLNLGNGAITLSCDSLDATNFVLHRYPLVLNDPDTPTGTTKGSESGSYNPGVSSVLVPNANNQVTLVFNVNCSMGDQLKFSSLSGTWLGYSDASGSLDYFTRANNGGSDDNIRLSIDLSATFTVTFDCDSGDASSLAISSVSVSEVSSFVRGQSYDVNSFYIQTSNDGNSWNLAGTILKKMHYPGANDAASFVAVDYNYSVAGSWTYMRVIERVSNGFDTADGNQDNTLVIADDSTQDTSAFASVNANNVYSFSKTGRYVVKITSGRRVRIDTHDSMVDTSVEHATNLYIVGRGRPGSYLYRGDYNTSQSFRLFAAKDITDPYPSYVGEYGGNGDTANNQGTAVTLMKGDSFEITDGVGSKSVNGSIENDATGYACWAISGTKVTIRRSATYKVFVDSLGVVHLDYIASVNGYGDGDALDWDYSYGEDTLHASGMTLRFGGKLDYSLLDAETTADGYKFYIQLKHVTNGTTGDIDYAFSNVSMPAGTTYKLKTNTQYSQGVNMSTPTSSGTLAAGSAGTYSSVSGTKYTLIEVTIPFSALTITNGVSGALAFRFDLSITYKETV